MQNGEAISTDSPSRSPGDSDASLHLRPARPPNSMSHGQTASPSKEKKLFYFPLRPDFFTYSTQDIHLIVNALVFSLI